MATISFTLTVLVLKTRPTCRCLFRGMEGKCRYSSLLVDEFSFNFPIICWNRVENLHFLNLLINLLFLYGAVTRFSNTPSVEFWELRGRNLPSSLRVLNIWRICPYDISHMYYTWYITDHFVTTHFVIQTVLNWTFAIRAWDTHRES